jgi:nucleotide-binding universal stress UspA family protein
MSREISVSFKISCYADLETSKDTLAKTIERKASGYDLIIMGTCGDDDLFDFLAGSNTYNVIRKSKVPVLVVPPKCTYSRIDKMVYAFNYLRERNLPLDQMIPWVQTMKCEVTVLQIMEEAESHDINDELKELQSIINHSQTDIQINFDTIRTPHVSEGISNYIAKKNIDVLALCTHHKYFLENLFHKSVLKRNVRTQTSHYPLFVFHH